MELVEWPQEGKYVLAVSGGADSMTLLDLMARHIGYTLVVAHFDHGLRATSAADRHLVEAAARRYHLPFVTHEAHLGTASEAQARAARHNWLREQVEATHALALITAHHLDDLLETSLLNLARGTGRRGLAPMPPGPVLRPLLRLGRDALRVYAEAEGLVWNEDPTNQDLANPRNYLRHRLLPAAPSEWREAYLKNLGQVAAVNQQIDRNLGILLSARRDESTGYSFPRELVRDLSLPELEELILAAAQSLLPGVEPTSRALREIALFAKTGAPHRFRMLVSGLRVARTPQALLLNCSFAHKKSAL
jgi:tRNA(Ile)-lysidine synthetase-like protein